MLKIKNQICDKEDLMINEGEEEERIFEWTLLYATKSGKIFGVSENLDKSTLVC